MLSRLNTYSHYFSKISVGRLLVLFVIGLTSLGLVVLASASQSFNQEGVSVFQKQLLWLAIALVGAFSVGLINLYRLREWTPYLIGLSLFLLFIVLIPGIGVSVNGAQRWLGLGPLRLQVSDVAKLGLIIGLADYLSKNQRHIKTFSKGFAIPCVGIGLTCALILVQPDFGTTFLCGTVGFGMLLLAGARLRYILPTLFGGITLFSVAVMLDPVRLKRLTSFLDVEGNKMGGAYQLWQGLLAFAAGGLGGTGPGNGRQQLSYLPEAHTDFIFPVIGEELGMFFTAGVVIIFMAIFLIGIIIIRRSPDLFHYTLIGGIILCIVLQALINIAVVTGLMPTKGMSLPFISYGGSNLVLMFVLVGILLNCLRQWKGPIVRARDL